MTAVPIVVESTTEEYFALYVKHDVDGTEVEIPVAVTLGEADTTTLAENVEALPAERYRVEKYLVADPADVDGDCIDDLTELADPVGLNPVNPAAAIARRDGVVAIPDLATFKAISFGGYLPKFVLLGMNTASPRLYFMNTRTTLIHEEFMNAVGIELGQEGMIEGSLMSRGDLVAPDGSLGAYCYWWRPRQHPYSFNVVARAHTMLAASMPLLEDDLVFYISNDALSHAQSDLPLYRESRIHLVFDDEFFPETGFLALNPGEGYGRLRVMDPDERPHPRDIVIYEALPNELPRVAGIISTVPQTPLSHVNLRAVQNGIPNAFIRDALDNDEIDALLGSYVRYEVTEDGWELRAASPEEVDSHYESSRPAQAQTPERDLSFTGITPLSEIGFEDWRAFGVKAANVAVLGTLGFPDGTVPDGFAVPFYFYDEFMKANGLYDEIEEMLADPAFQTDFDEQEDDLKDLRKAIKDAETPQWITDALTAMHATYPEGQSLRYRSSTNNEDLPGFNGAGLYDSKTQKPDETEEDGIDKSLKQVYASLWNFRAFSEREFHRIDHLAAAMGVLVHPNYTDELANGVAVSFDLLYGREGRYYVNTQVGEDLVTNPEAHSVPEEILLDEYGFHIVLATSNQVEPGELLLSDDQVNQLRRHLEVIHDHFETLYNPAPEEPFAMEIEFKITSANILAIKQARPWVFDTASSGDMDEIAPRFSSALVNGATLTLVYSEPLDSSSVPGNDAFTVTGGNRTRRVTRVRVSGSSVELTLDPAVEDGETNLRVSYAVPTGTGATPIQDAAGNDAAGLSAEPVTNETADTTPPTVSQLEITSDAGSDATYAIGDDIEVTVTFSEDVLVTGRPQLTLRVGDQDRTADYESVTDAEVLFRYRVVTGDIDTNGVSIAAGSLSLNGGTIKDGSNNEADLDHRALRNQSRHKVEGIKPELAATRGAVVNGAMLTLTYTETLDSASTPPSSAFFVSGGSSSRTVSGVAMSGSTVKLTLSSAVAHWETGVRVSYTVPAGMAAAPIQDRVGNNADGLSSEPVTNETPDRIPPTVTSVEITSDPPDGRDVYGIGEEIEVTVTFSETVIVSGTPRVTLKVGERNRSANYESVAGAVVAFAYTVAVNDSDTDGVSIEAGSLSGGTIRDTARNHAVRTHMGVAADTGQKVDGIKPKLATTDGAVANATVLTLAYSEPLDGSSVPGNDAFSVTGGNETRTVTGVQVSGSAVELTLSPAVEHGETGIRVSYTIPTGTGANPIQDRAGNDVDRLNNRRVTNNTGDVTGPTVEMVRITSNAGSDGTYTVDDLIEVTVTFNETVVVTGTPRLTLNVGGQNRTAEYLSVTGAAVKFEYRVARGDNDRDGVSIDADSLSRGGGTIRDGARNDATLTHAGVAADSRHQVDGVAPVLATTDGAVANGPMLTLAYSEPLRSSSRPAASAFTVTGGNEARTVTRVQVSGSAVLLTLNPAVTDGESGLRLSYQPGGNPIEDVVGNAADGLNNRPVTNNTGDTTGPTVETVRITSNAGSDRSYAVGETIEVTVTFSETVVVTGTPRLTLNVGGRSRTANYQDVTGAAVRFEYQVVSSDAAPYGVSIDANRLSGGTIRDGARNNAVLNHAPVAADSRHQVDGVKPTLASSDGAVVNGTTLTLAYGEPLDSSSVPATDDFTVTGGSETRTVTGVRVSGSAVFLTLSPAVADGESRLRVNYEPGSNPIQDTAGNDADRLSNKSVTNRTGDTTGPAVSTVRITSSAGSDRTYGVDETIEVTVTFDETMVITGMPELTLNVGDRNRTAEYQSVSSRAVKFAYRVVTGDNDEDGVSLESNRLSRGGGTIRDGAGNDAVLDHDAVEASSSHKVDAVAPVLALTDPVVVNGATLTLTYNEPLNTSSRPANSDFTVEGGNETRTVTRVQVTGSTVRLTVSPAAEHGETGIRVTYEPRSNPIQDRVGNDAEGFRDQFVDNLTPDTTAPSIEGIEISSDPGTDETYAIGDMILVTVRYDETVTVDTVRGTPTLDLLVGNRRKRASAGTGPARAAVVFVYTVEEGDEDEDGVSVPRGSIALNGGKILDLSNNAAVRSYEAVEAQSDHKVDGAEPELESVTVHGSRVALNYDEPLDEGSVPSRSDFAVTVAGE